MAETLVFSFDGLVTEADRGYIRHVPLPAEQGDWRGGVLYFAAHVRSMPVPQVLRLQYTAWQDDWTRASHSSHEATPGMTVTWSQVVDTMPGTVDWSRDRQSHGFIVQNAAGKPVSDYNYWDWNGEDPTEWYPMDVRFLVVLVPAGEEFGGWEEYEMSEQQKWVEYTLNEGVEVITRLVNASQMALEVWGPGESPLPGDLPVDVTLEVPLTLSIRVNEDGSATILGVS